MHRLIVLLRGINVSGHRKVPMADLRETCRELGFTQVESYIQSGNLVLSSPRDARATVALLEPALEQRFGFAVDVVARTAEQWARYARGSPFPDAEQTAPNLLQLALSKQEPKPEAVAVLRERAGMGELVEQVGDALWVYFPQGVARSRLSPALFDKAAGSPVTGRNWRTVVKLHEMAGGERTESR